MWRSEGRAGEGKAACMYVATVSSQDSLVERRLRALGLLLNSQSVARRPAPSTAEATAARCMLIGPPKKL